jgi:limonene-1,2-epoxide hydrolase
MSPSEVVTAFIEHVNAMDLEAAFALLADDIEYDNVPIGKNHGIESVKNVLGPFVGMCQEVAWIIHEQAERGDTVLNERTDRFVINGKTLDLPVAGVFKVADGKITLWRDYFDDATFRALLS